MRTNIEINDSLINKAKKLTKSRTKKEVVNKALENLIKTEKRRKLLNLYGKVKWQRSLKQIRG